MPCVGPRGRHPASEPHGQWLNSQPPRYDCCSCFYLYHYHYHYPLPTSHLPLATSHQPPATTTTTTTLPSNTLVTSHLPPLPRPLPLPPAMAKADGLLRYSVWPGSRQNACGPTFQAPFIVHSAVGQPKGTLAQLSNPFWAPNLCHDPVLAPKWLPSVFPQRAGRLRTVRAPQTSSEGQFRLSVRAVFGPQVAQRHLPCRRSLPRAARTEGHSNMAASCPGSTVLADGHTVSNAPDLFRPPKLSGTGPG